ncbi:hypothetical protein HDV02_002072 [Globomyces sp. JEL0801]|nr:hypothetical protein HDV02_002072 [Globomyces sp. JEL0801]
MMMILSVLCAGMLVEAHYVKYIQHNSIKWVHHSSVTTNPKSNSRWNAEYRYAVVALSPDPTVAAGKSVSGYATITQFNVGEPSIVTLDIKGLEPNSIHGLHFHEFGAIWPNCTSAGAHWNPSKVTHGDPSTPTRHHGDLGNFKVNENGAGLFSSENNLLTLYGENSVIGRSLVVHEKIDDLGKGGDNGSITVGNSGARLACGVVGRS